MKKFTTKSLLLASAVMSALPAMAWENDQVLLIDGFQTTMVAADFDNNGYLDLYYGGNISTPWMLCSRGYAEQHISVMAYNNGDKTFTFDWTKPVEYVDGNGNNNAFLYVPDHGIAPSVRNNFLAADLNNDGLVDLVRICKDSGYGSNYFWGGDDKEYGRGEKGDVEQIDEREEYRMAVYYNNGDGSFTKASRDNGLRWDSMVIDWEGYSYIRPLSAGDYNNDGFIDLMVSYRDTADGWRCRTEIFRNNGDGTFTSVENLPFADLFGNFQFADLNNDGLLDVVANNANNGNRVEVYLNNGEGGFNGSIQANVSPQKSSMVIADFDNDGELEIFTEGWDWWWAEESPDGNEWGHHAVIHKFNGNGFTSRYIDSGSERSYAFAGDINGDGYNDIIFPTHEHGAARYRLSDGNLGFNYSYLDEAPASTDYTFGTTGFVADFTNNGLADLVVTKERDTENKEYFNPKGTRIYINENAAVEAPEAPAKAEYIVEDGVLRINWEAASDADVLLPIRYNVMVTYKDGSVYSLIPADKESGFIRIAEGRQVLLAQNVRSYSIPVGDREVESVGVQTVATNSSKASTFTAADLLTGVDCINAENAAEKEYFNLQGIRVANPEKGGIYIMRQGQKSSKIVL